MEHRYTDRHRVSFGDLLIGGLVAWLLFMGVFSGDGFQLIIGLLFLGFLLFTRHRRYEISTTELVIRYLGPRQSIVPLTDIEAAETVRMPLSGGGVLIRRQDGRRVVLTPTDPERFLQELRALMGR